MGKRNKRQALDRYDLAILSALSLNTRLTAVELARRVHLSRTAVSRRIAALKRTKVLNDAADVLNYESLGFKVRARVDIPAHGRAHPGVVPELLRRPEVLSVSVLAGDGLLSLDVIAFDMDHLHRFVESVQGEGRTATKVVRVLEKSELTLTERMRRLAEAPDRC
ncbi:MAG: Lrp/AsnC family transcriptional regulator [Proteobacteria bacterium]|nr:Lrp/AsnC family transcriptional regulator [Pseudomonadota bacterium]